jgi:hypothetical protein
VIKNLLLGFRMKTITNKDREVYKLMVAIDFVNYHIEPNNF